VRRLLLLILWPRAVWSDLGAHPVPVRRLVLGILLPLAAGIAAAQQIGWSWLNTDRSPQYGWSSQPLFGDASLAVVFGLALAGPLALAATIMWLAPWCGGRRDWARSVSVATWGTLPWLVAACSLFFMPMILVCMAAAALCFRLHAIGVCELLGVPPEDGADLVIGSWLVMGAGASFTGLLLELL
jgi:hypothetical protein